MHTSEYRIEKIRVPVVLTTIGGARFEGDMFVQSYARHRLGQEWPEDVMNSDEPYFPLALPGGTELIAKDQVAEVEVEAAPESEHAFDVGARPSEIELATIDGETRNGSIMLEVTHDRPRVLDYLNRFTARFLTLYTEDGIRLINRCRIARVRQLS